MVSGTLGIVPELFRGGEAVLMELIGRKVGGSVLMALVVKVEDLLKGGTEVVFDALCGNTVVLLGNEATRFLSGAKVFTGCAGRGRSGGMGLVREGLLGLKCLPGLLIKASEVEVILEVLDVCVGVVFTLVVVVVTVLGVAVVVEPVVGFGSSISGLTTTKEVTGVTKLYFRERLVAFSVSKRCANGSELLSLAIKSSLIV